MAGGQPKSKAARRPASPASGGSSAENGQNSPAFTAQGGEGVVSPAPANPPHILLDQVSKSFNGKPVLDQVSLAVPKGQVTVVIGGSGHGKSTLLRLIVGFIRPDSGHIWVNGQDVLEMDEDGRMEVQKKIGMAFQYAALFDSMSVYENLAFPLREHSRLSEPEIQDRVAQMLERLKLGGIEGKAPAELSGGMRKRVGVARALMLQPEIMLFDEPESGLDPINTTSIGELIMEMRDLLGITCLVISHNIENSMMIADKIAMLYKGRILAEGPPPVIAKLDQPVVRQFLTGSAHGPF